MPTSPREFREEKLFSSPASEFGPEHPAASRTSRRRKNLGSSDLGRASAPLSHLNPSLFSSKIKTTSAFPQLKWPAPPSSPSLASASRSSPPARTPCPVRNLRMSSGMATAEILHDLTSQVLPLSLSRRLFSFFRFAQLLLLSIPSNPPTAAPARSLLEKAGGEGE